MAVIESENDTPGVRAIVWSLGVTLLWCCISVRPAGSCPHRQASAAGNQDNDCNTTVHGK